MVSGVVIGDSLVKKIEYGVGDNFYYAVPFSNSSDRLDICVSTQIGCPMKCGFCATGDMPFVRNLSSEEVSNQIIQGVGVMEGVVRDQSIKRIKVLAEGMGEVSFNLENVVEGFKDARRNLFESYGFFRQIDFGLSTVGNTSLISAYRNLALSDLDPRTTYDFQLSLHSADTDQRRKIIPNMPKIGGREQPFLESVDSFCELARDLGQPMKFNYLLLNSGSGWNNYDSPSLDALVNLCHYVEKRGVLPVVKLTKYSDTKKGFFSPDESVYGDLINRLEFEGISAYHVPLVGQDIRGACGQLNYKK